MRLTPPAPLPAPRHQPQQEFTQEQFVNGSALRLECSCRGDLALRHRECVMKWVQVKGSNVCELCKAEIRNIPAPPPRPTEADLPQLDEAYFHGAAVGRAGAGSLGLCDERSCGVPRRAQAVQAAGACRAAGALAGPLHAALN